MESENILLLVELATSGLVTVTIQDDYNKVEVASREALHRLVDQLQDLLYTSWVKFPDDRRDEPAEVIPIREPAPVPVYDTLEEANDYGALRGPRSIGRPDFGPYIDMEEVRS